MTRTHDHYEHHHHYYARINISGSSLLGTHQEWPVSCLPWLRWPLEMVSTAACTEAVRLRQTTILLTAHPLDLSPLLHSSPKRTHYTNQKEKLTASKSFAGLQGEKGRMDRARKEAERDHGNNMQLGIQEQVSDEANPLPAPGTDQLAHCELAAVVKSSKRMDGWMDGGSRHQPPKSLSKQRFGEERSGRGTGNSGCRQHTGGRDSYWRTTKGGGAKLRRWQ
uniref:Uncharacterized protein n=1 Tax=Arundo donax TaxID=35708 RepID=A0A0A9FBX2_ARUDO